MNTIDKNVLSMLKKGIWLYFFLLIFEGALRKWFLPGLASPLLIIRDPLALWILFEVWRQGYLPSTPYLYLMIAIGSIGIVTAILFGHGNAFVALFGARILVIQFPLMFAIGVIFDKEDVLKMGRMLLLLSFPLAVLIAVQFYSPQSAWVNRGIGGDVEGSGFSGSMGFFRPSGTFSFTNGNSLFFQFVAAYVIYFWLNPETINRTVLILASIAVIMSVPLSISRTLFFSIVVTLFFAASGALFNSKYTGKIVVAGVAIFFSLLIVSQLEFFQTATEAFTDRFDTANTSEGGLEGVLGDRYLGGLIKAIKGSVEQSFFGLGIGMGTNVGSQLLTGKTTFLISEGEWGRVIGEMGAIMGLGVIFIRLGFCWEIFINGYRKMVTGDLLPWILLSFGLLVIPQGQWAQPTTLGFSILIGGLIISSFNERDDAEDLDDSYLKQTS